MRIRNPLQNCNRLLNHTVEALCHRTSCQLRNIALKSSYSRQNLLEQKLTKSTTDLQRKLPNTVDSKAVFQATENSYRRELSNLFRRKTGKVLSLAREDPILKPLVDLRYPILTDKFPPSHKAQPTAISRNNVFNISRHALSPAEKSLLEKGLSYCPTRQLDPVSLGFDLHQFIRRVRLREYFGESQGDFVYTPTVVKQRAEWTPPEGRNQCIDRFTTSAMAHFDAFIAANRSKPVKPNLRPQERKAIGSLRRNPDIIIRPAIKGGALTILNTKFYIGL
ncbi:hypothetical protein HOLleu_27652 [Holothuria leucospilota]|uniref:Uncharacterized protein n=1 Tax=Holothuria leucospilota TaxID=206669 RepID=A0A9Q1H3M5_HOLLE|nr:hypothetical protein HOLleu_27652 [Holothuria leucospilota]